MSAEATEYVEITVDGLPTPVTPEQAKDPNIEEIVRANRLLLRVDGTDTSAAAQSLMDTALDDEDE